MVAGAIFFSFFFRVTGGCQICDFEYDKVLSYGVESYIYMCCKTYLNACNKAGGKQLNIEVVPQGPVWTTWVYWGSLRKRRSQVPNKSPPGYQSVGGVHIPVPGR